MRFMVLIKANEASEAGTLPSGELLTAMGRYNEELAKAGVLLAGEGLQPSSKGARVRLSGVAPAVTRGPFPVSGGLVAGFWMLRVASLDEAVEWVKRCPNPLGDETEIEIRQVFEAEDFGEAFTPEMRGAEEHLRAEVARHTGGEGR